MKCHGISKNSVAWHKILHDMEYHGPHLYVELNGPRSVYACIMRTHLHYEDTSTHSDKSIA